MQLETTYPTRPCYVDGKKAMFHRWADKSEIVSPGISAGSHSGGTIRATLAIVEFEDGSVAEVYPYKVRFADGGKFMDTVFLPEIGGVNNDLA